MKYYVRYPIGIPTYSQDFETFIMIGRFLHMYCPTFKKWFIVVPAPENVAYLLRHHTAIDRISADLFFRSTPRRARLEWWEDVLGLRATKIAQWVRRRIPLTKNLRWLRQLAMLDTECDWSEWNISSDKPRFYVVLSNDPRTMGPTDDHPASPGSTSAPD